MSGDNLETSPSEPPTPKRARIPLQNRITNLAVPLRLHIFGFLDQYDILCPTIYGGIRFNYGYRMDPCWSLPYPIFSWQEGYHNFRYKPYTIETAIACMLGDCEVLQYLQGMPSNPWSVDRCDSVSCGMSDKDIQSFFYFLNVLLVGYNNIKTLRYARQMNFPWNEWALDTGIRYGVDLPILKWMHKQGCPFSRSTLGVAASWRDTSVLDWLLDIQCPMSEWTFQLALEKCSLKHVIRLRSHGCPWNKEALLRAISNVHEDNDAIFKFLLDEQCPLHNTAPHDVIVFGTFSHLKAFHEANKTFEDSHLFLAIIRNKNRKYLRYLKRIVSPWNAGTFRLAVEYVTQGYPYVSEDRKLDILIWLKKHGCPWDSSAYSEAVERGRLDILKWLKAEGCPWDSSVFSVAVDVGYLFILKWLKSEGCPFDPSVFSVAVEVGNLNILKWLKSEGFLWDESTFIKAIKKGDIEVIRWLYEEKCPPSNEPAFEALMEKYLEIAK
jgi:hypothetical protein